MSRFATPMNKGSSVHRLNTFCCYIYYLHGVCPQWIRDLGLRSPKYMKCRTALNNKVVECPRCLGLSLEDLLLTLFLSQHQKAILTSSFYVGGANGVGFDQVLFITRLIFKSLTS